MPGACRILSAGVALRSISGRASHRTSPATLCQTRSLLSRRQTSFWAPSYPMDNKGDSLSGLQVPYVPPSPISPSLDDAGAQTALPKPKEPKHRYLDSLMDKAGEMTLRCSILDAEGNWGTDGHKHSKTEICREYDLDFRDLRKLDSLSPNLVPVILTRKTCILISILHIRVLIKPDSVIVFDSTGAQATETQRRFKYHLERNIKSGLEVEDTNGDTEITPAGEEYLSYEHRALESVLVATANALEHEMAFTRHLVRQLLKDLEDNINRENLKKLLHYSKKTAAFQSRARYVKSAIDEVLDSDEDLSAMYLTSRSQGRPRALHDHEQLELLLESFVKQVEEIVSEVDTTVANMNTTQEIAELMLDSGRNALLALDIKINIVTLGVGTSALMAGLFGMNLTSHIEETPYAFLVVSSTALFFAFLITTYGLRTLRRVRRVALSGQNSTVLSSVLHSPAWDSSVAQFSKGFDPSLVDMRSEMAKRAIWERVWHGLGRKRKEPEPKNKWIQRPGPGTRRGLTMGMAKEAQEARWRTWSSRQESKR